MGTEGVGSSVVIALAAVLWLVYLVPTWFRRREYLSTERNAVRLQQTIRILAETAEVPDEVRVESTARDAARQEKLLRRHYEQERTIARARDAALERAAVRTLADLKPDVAAEVVAHGPAARRLRRSRAATSVVLLLAVAATAASAPLASLPLLAAGSVSAVLCIVLLSRFAAVARSRAALARTLRSQPAPQRRLVLPEPSATVPQARVPEWTPVPLPRPLYLSKPAPQSLVSPAMVAESRDRMLDELAEQERVERERKVTPLRPYEPARAVAPGPARAPDVEPIGAPASRYASMGFIGNVGTSAPDLDAVLRRRRAV